MTLVGKVARVMARVTSSEAGEVMVPSEKGNDAYYAYSVDEGAEFSPGTQVVIIEQAGRTLYVTSQ